jgi:hypothetical protein
VSIPRFRWFTRALSRVTWTHLTRAAGLIGLAYEITVDKIDRPTVLIVLGSMILGVEAFRKDRSEATKTKSGDGGAT